jgi:hypothetical protein
MPNDYGIKIEITSEVENAIAQMKQLETAIKQVQDLSGTDAGRALKGAEQNLSLTKENAKAQLELFKAQTQSAISEDSVLQVYRGNTI